MTDVSIDPSEGGVEYSDGSPVKGDAVTNAECTLDLKSCAPPNPCHVGILNCSDAGKQSCADTNALQADGTPCGQGKVCSAGACTACDEGATCLVPGKPCRVAKTSCSTGKAICTEIDNALAGAACGAKMVCSGADCVACVDGAGCVPQNQCHSGMLSCTGATPQCIDQNANVANGSECGQDQVCNDGSCAACKAGASCMVTNPCRSGMLACNTGSPTCLESANALNGVTCGAGKVCKDGACTDCVEGATCSPANQCHQGRLGCTGGNPTCADTMNAVAAGTSCGTDKVCNQGACVDCPGDRACTPDGMMCKVGKTSCATGSSVCSATGNAANGLSCGNNMVCNGGGCIACAAGTSCAPANPCHTGTLACSGGNPSCSDTGVALSNGTGCGNNLVCSSGSCVSCTANAACVPGGNVCKTGATSCATGTSACVANGNASNGLSCGTNMVCNNGTCMACAAGSACQPSNACHTGTLSCAAGSPTCTDTGSSLANGSSCGTNLVCNGGSCVGCTAGGSCTPALCKTGNYACSTGTQVCNANGNVGDGSPCGAGQVCFQGNCKVRDCSGPASCGAADGAGGFCVGASGNCLGKPNTSASCVGSTCSYVCDRSPLSCGTSAAPACGSWTFESGTLENWSLRPISLPGASLTNVTTFAVDGTHSLAVTYPSGPTGNANVRFGTLLCPNSNAIGVLGKTLHAAIRFEGTTQYTNSMLAYLELDNGPTLVAGWDDTTIPAGGGWIQLDSLISPAVLGAAADQITEIRIVVESSGDINGTVYLDNISLQ